MSGTTPDILDAARAAVTQRGAAYGPPAAAFLALLAKHWSLILGHEVTASQAGRMMIAFKLARLAQNPGHRDSIVDVAGYAFMLGELPGCAESECYQQSGVSRQLEADSRKLTAESEMK